MPGLPRRPGHLPRRHRERSRPHLPADLRRHLFEGGIRETEACPWARQSRDPGDRKTPVTAADLLNDRVVPFFDEKDVKLSRVLTDRGTEYRGNPAHHE